MYHIHVVCYNYPSDRRGRVPLFISKINSLKLFDMCMKMDGNVESLKYFEKLFIGF